VRPVNIVHIRVAIYGSDRPKYMAIFDI
jgi:hypothetical protein